MTTQVPQCFFCKHYMKPKNKSYTCEAFDGYIPADILSNEFDHTKSYNGDHGLRYDDIENIVTKPAKSAVSYAGFPLGKDITIQAGFPLKGGEGSGNFDHDGRPGELGGSGGGGSGGGGGGSGSGGGRSAADAISSIKGPTVIGPNDPRHDAAVDVVRNECRNSVKPQMLTHYDHADFKDSTIILSNGGKTGCAVANKDSPREEEFSKGELISLYNNDGEHQAPAIITEGINQGGVKLGCFGGRLSNYYPSFGFAEVESTPFNPEYAPKEGEHNAPKDWNYEKDDNPPFVTMVLGAGKMQHAAASGIKTKGV